MGNSFQRIGSKSNAHVGIICAHIRIWFQMELSFGSMTNKHQMQNKSAHNITAIQRMGRAGS